MNDPVVSRAVLDRLKAPSELALAQRILDSVASTAEPLETAAFLANYPKVLAGSRNVTPAREAFLKAAALSVPGAKYAELNKQKNSLLPVYKNPQAAALARTLRELRCDFKRFCHLYTDGRLLPLSVFVAALELPQSVQLQRQCYRFTPELVELRNKMVKEYLRIKRALVLQPRRASNRNDEKTKQWRSDRVTVDSRNRWEAKLCQVSSLIACWERFECRWLQEQERHAVIALQPLVSAISAAEAILKSCRKQLILPEPAATKQQECTFRALQAFCCSVTTLANDLLPVESSCLFLDANTIVLAAAIAEDAAIPAANAAAAPNPTAKRIRATSQIEGTAEQPEASETTKECSGSIWDVLHLASLARVAKVDKEDVVVYSAKRFLLCSARYLVACFLELLHQVWEARLCLTHMGPALVTSRPCLVSALSNFDQALANFRLPPSTQRGGAADAGPAQRSIPVYE